MVNDTVDISIGALLLYGLMLVIPFLIFRYLILKKQRTMFVSIVRMVIQLSFVAVYLKYIFQINSVAINILWILVMVVVANFSVLNQSGLKARKLFPYTFLAFLISITVTMSSMLLVFEWSVFLSSRYMIPLSGMILGNILRGSIISLERFYSSIKRRENEYIYYVLLGAGRFEALKPFIREAMNSAVSPQLAAIATMGLVSLPGMMTGQILGGSMPVTAIKYQLLILIAIFTTAVLSTFLGILFSSVKAFDSSQRLDKGIYKSL